MQRNSVSFLGLLEFLMLELFNASNNLENVNMVDSQVIYVRIPFHVAVSGAEVQYEWQKLSPSSDNTQSTNYPYTSCKVLKFNLFFHMLERILKQFVLPYILEWNDLINLQPHTVKRCKPVEIRGDN